jgi:RND family efflux transporter MFP subunit
MRSCFACFALLLLAAAPLQAAGQLKGWLEFVQKVGMRAVENGVVESVPVSTGQHVKKGDLMLRMDQREARAKLLEAKATVARARINADKAQRQLDRTQEMFDRGLIAQEELNDAELEMAAATAEEESAKAFEAAAQVSLDRTELKAPFDGIVVARNVWEGEVVYKTLQQEPLLVVAPDGFMLARALVTANVLRTFKPGQQAAVNILGKLREARVYSMGVEPVRVDLQGAVYALDLIFERRPNEVLRPSETVQIVLP